MIGNPPYVRQEKLTNEYKNLLCSTYPNIGNGIADLYVYFFGLGLKLLNPQGVLVLITLNKYLKTKYGKELRNTLATGVTVDLIIDFFELPVFNASTDASITKIFKEKKAISTRYFPIKTLDNLDLEKTTKGDFQITIKDEDEWKFIDYRDKTILEKIHTNTQSLKEFTNDKIFYGVKTGANEVFVLKNEVAQQLLNSESAPLVKRYAKPTSIKKWQIEGDENYFLATGYDIDLIKYPTALNYVNNFKNKLQTRCDKGVNYWNLRACAYYDEFEKTKLLYIHTAVDHQFYYDTEGHYINNSCYMIVSDSKFLFAFLNSKLFKWFKKIKFVAYGDGATSGRCKLDYNKMITVPIKKNVDETPFEELINVILSAKQANPQADTVELENQIDVLVYKLYDLTYDELKIIDPYFQLSEAEYDDIK